MKFKASQLRSLSDFFVAVAAAWFIAGIVTPVFTKPPLTVGLVSDILLGVIGAAGFLYISLLVFRRGLK